MLNIFQHNLCFIFFNIIYASNFLAYYLQVRVHATNMKFFNIFFIFMPAGSPGGRQLLFHGPGRAAKIFGWPGPARAPVSEPR